MSTPKCVAIYCRVSTRGQEDDGTSLETQEAHCRRYAAEHGLMVDEAHVYREVHTGTELWERPQLTALRTAIRRREITTVVAHAIDRLSRDPVHMGVVLSEADHAGATVRFVTEPLDDSPEGQLIRFVRGYAAKVEHEKIRERTQRGKRARVEAGKMPPSHNPLYGYQWADETRSRYVIDPQAAPIVRRVFAEALAGGTLRGIAHRLTDEGVPTLRKAIMWDYTIIGAILRNPAYTGQAFAFRTKREKVPGTNKWRAVPRPPEEWVELPEGTIPPLIDAATFAAAQERLRLNKLRAPRNNGDPKGALLRGGYVRCGHCGRAAYVRNQRNCEAVYTSYACSKTLRSNGTCVRPSISAKMLDAAVWERIMAILSDPSIIASELQRLQRDDPTSVDVSAVRKALADVSRKQGNLIDRLADIDDDGLAEAVKAKLATLTAQRRQLELEQAAVLARRAVWEAAQQRLADVQDWCRSVAAQLGELAYTQKRLALDALNVQVQIFTAGYTPRYIITASVPLELEEGVTAPLASAIDMSPSDGRCTRCSGRRAPGSPATEGSRRSVGRCARSCRTR